ncbi:T9SS type A sorting domain-containing protein [Spirosoma sp. HMF4905]|uniref:T9SS type A sorting domain-containing protein n=1 Tax=Spirosoma arboris TaxID=2682092 RepID=A0A7K1SEC2_9BACT|nr:T9SS type A sorting domain-containing protein [Spirosoma arboris]MVM32155.1 T9SS type A sorting domain-containing protein [Spirosoma arboris]
MEKTVLAVSRFTPALLLAVAFSGGVQAQQTVSPSPKSPNNEVNVRIIERNGDEVREVERTYRMDGMTDPERDKMVMKLVDSLKATRKDGRKRQMTIIVEDNDGDRVVSRKRISPGMKRIPRDAYVQRGKLPRNDWDPGNSQTWQYDFRRGTDSMADQLRRFKLEFPKDFDRQLIRPFEDWSRNLNGKPSTIRGLDAFPNNPDRDQLNVRFTAPTKGDVSIIVTNPKGKEVAKREIKDFSGEFVGQVDLGKKAQGIYFITVTQNEDGAVKRVIVE